MNRRVRIGDVELAVLEAGPGGHPLLLAHGFTGAKEDFADHLDGLAARGWHVVAPDHRGHGESDAPAAELAYSLEVIAADLTALADALGWSRFVLLGHSMGGMAAQVLTLEHPDRVSALILMDTAHGPLEGFDLDEIRLGQEIVRTDGMEVLAKVQAERDDPLASPAHLRLLAEKEGYAEFGRRKLLAAAPAMWAAMVERMIDQGDRLDALSGLALPTLVIVGDEDVRFIAPSERLAATIPGARLAVIPAAGHSPQFENPDAWWDALTRFLDALEVTE